MADYTLVVDNTKNFPNITIYKQIANINGEHFGYMAKPNEGYVMYNPNSNDMELDENGNWIPTIYYRTIAGFPLNYDFSRFPYIAVLRSTVPADHIFGKGDDMEVV